MASRTLQQDKPARQLYPERKRFTVHDFHAMIEARIFTKDDRLELIDGEIIKMSPIGKQHALCVRNLMNLLAPHLSKTILLDAQNPLRLSEEREFYPDVFLLWSTPNISAGNIPLADDVLLLIEVSDTTLRFDRTTKLASYAEADLPEVWIVDLKGERVLIHRKPLDGVYGQVEEVTKDGILSIEALDDAELKVADIL